MTTAQVFRAALLVAISATAAAAQTQRPRASLEVPQIEVAASPGSAVSVVVGVSMPDEVHVQANRPDDPLLIPTVLTIEVPEGITVEAVTYPQPVEFAQAARDQPLLVLGPRFDISARLLIGEGIAEGLRSVPIVLRYQACDESVCFPPARATAAWTLRVTR